MIAWAKAKRERLRGAHLAPDYIPTAAAPPGLSRWAAPLRAQPCCPAAVFAGCCRCSVCSDGCEQHLIHPAGLPAFFPTARLRDKKRAEEAVVAASGSESEPEAEEEMRLKFLGGGAAAPAADARAAGGRGERRRGAAAAAAAADEDGEEDEAWAQEQIRKGMGGLMAPAAAAGGRPGSAAAPADGEAGARGASAAFAAAGASQAAAIQAQADEVMRALQAGLQRLQASRQQAEKHLERTRGSLKVRRGCWAAGCRYCCSRHHSPLLLQSVHAPNLLAWPWAPRRCPKAQAHI